MPSINKKQAFEILDEIKKGTCEGACRKTWLHNIRYALKAGSNPLHLTVTERKKMISKLKTINTHGNARKNQSLTDKYLLRKSPPFPANQYCGKTKKGNDGKMYISVPDKNNICRWKLK